MYLVTQEGGLKSKIKVPSHIVTDESKIKGSSHAVTDESKIKVKNKVTDEYNNR